MSAAFPATVREAWGAQCPSCGEDDSIDVEAIVAVRLRPDGTDPGEAGQQDHHWDDSSPACCGACGYHGVMSEFYVAKAGGAP